MDTSQKQYRVSERSQLRINLKAEMWTVSFHSMGPGPLTKAQGERRKDRHTCREELGLVASHGEVAAPWKLSVLSIGAELLRTAGDRLAHLGGSNLCSGAIFRH